MLEENDMKVLRKIVGKTKNRSNKKPANQRYLLYLLMRGWKEEEEENGTNMLEEWMLRDQFEISRDNMPAGRRSPERPKRRWSDLIPD